jgi:hypothetical protein
MAIASSTGRAKARKEVPVEQTTLSIQGDAEELRVPQEPRLRATMLTLMADAILAVHRAHHARTRAGEEERDDDART